LWTNTGVSTGLRLSHLTSSNAAYGSFVWTDRSSDTAVNPTAQNQTIFRSSGGYKLYSDSGLSAGVSLSPGAGAWSNISDRNMKANFSAVDTRAVLRGVLDLPISTWNYKSQDETVRHMGPMAQDFQAAFGVGEDDKHISTIDPDGVALAAIQGLNEELRDRDAKISAQQEELEKQKTKLSAIEAQMQEQRKLIDMIRSEKL
ncbi:MAG TPA: tail fiber domain-containing protein, partial [Luteolibacter sp.]